MNVSWKMDQGKGLFAPAQKKGAVATAKLELVFDNHDYSRNLILRKDGCLFFENDNISFSIDNKEDRRRGIVVQTLRIRAKKEGVLKSRYIATLLCSRKEGKVFVPMHWSYLGDTERLKQIDTYYPHYTWMEGYKEQLRTPAVCAWDKGRNVTVASLGPHPSHIVIDKCPGGLRFIVCLDRPRIGPDGYDANPTLSCGEELTTQLYWDTCEGDWQTGMKRWMSYNMANVVKDEDIPPAWTKKIRMYWCRWDRINKRDIDEMADKHPDWCALNEDGSRHSSGYIYMCTNVEAFRQAKVKEAVDAVKRGYDGIRYDNALVLNCFSKEHKHTMTYAH